MTYSKLHRASDRMATSILQRSGPESEPVALLLEQGAAATLSILGILKAGKYYVPLDVNAQDEWLAAVLEEIQPPLVLTSRQYMARVRALVRPPAAVVGIESLGRDRSLRATRVNPQDPAYVYFTSGTTGRPKGVVDSHRNVLHNVMRYTNSLAIGSGDRLSLLQSIGFSGTVSSLFAALLNGACVFPLDLRRENVETIATWLQKQEVTIYHSVPTIFRSLASRARQFPSVRIVRLEGDRASSADLERFRQHFSQAAVLVNGLGTTETGLVCQFFADHETRLEDGRMPVGYATAGMEVEIVDGEGRQLSHGEVGEIAVTSRYLASGYWQRPALTERVFEPVPGRPDFRVYRTGDLGRMDESGCVEHLGRVDSRVRNRGQWVVPARIEDALIALPEVQEAAVVVRQAAGGRLRILAYVTTTTGLPPVKVLREALLSSLPLQALPSRVVALDELPATKSGKIDKAALPEPDRLRPDTGHAAVPPFSTLHHLLLDVWEDLLEVDGIGITDSFFDLGGDSLLALEMIDRVEGLLERSLPPDLLLGEATVERVADLLVGSEDELLGPLLELNPAGKLQPLFFLHGDYLAGGYYSIGLARHLGPDRPLCLLRPIGLGEESIPGSYREMAEEHVRVMQARQPRGPYLIAGTCNGGLIGYEMARLLTERGERVAQLIMIDSSAANLRFFGLYRILGLTRRPGAGTQLQEPLYLLVRRLVARMLEMKMGALVPYVLSRLRGPVDPSALGPRQGTQRSRHRAESRTPAGYWTRLRSGYQRLDHTYFPAEYDGRAELLWPAAADGETVNRARDWWRRVCPQIQVRVVPGNSITCLTRHVKDLGQAINDCLEGGACECDSSVDARLSSAGGVKDVVESAQINE